MTKQGIKKVENFIKSVQFNDADLDFKEFFRAKMREARKFNLKILEPINYNFEVRHIGDFTKGPEKFSHNQFDKMEILLKKLQLRYDIIDKTFIIYDDRLE